MIVAKKLKKAVVLILYITLFKLILVSIYAYRVKAEQKYESRQEMKRKIHSPYTLKIDKS